MSVTTKRKQAHGGTRAGSGKRSLFAGKRTTPYGMLLPEPVGKLIDQQRKRLTREAKLTQLISRADLTSALAILHAKALTVDDLTRAIELAGRG